MNTTQRVYIHALVFSTAMFVWLTRASGDDLTGIGDDEVTTSTTATPMTWRPVIWSFYVDAQSSGGKAFGAGDVKNTPATTASPTDVALWEWLEPQIRIRRAGGTREDLEKQRQALRDQIDKVREQYNAEQDADRRRQLEAQIKGLEDQMQSIDPDKGTGTIYSSTEPVLSGWQRGLDPTTGAMQIGTRGDGIGQYTSEEAGENKELIFKPHRIQQIYWQTPGVLRIDTDILMSADPAQKDQKLREHFKLLKLSITAHPIKLDRAAINSDPMRLIEPAVVRGFALEQGSDEAVGEVKKWATVERKPNEARPWSEDGFVRQFQYEPHPTFPGIWEYRITASIMGRMDETEEYETKNVEGAIRIAFVKDRVINFERLNFEGSRKAGQSDIWKDGRLQGTTQQSPPGR